MIALFPLLFLVSPYVQPYTCGHRILTLFWALKSFLSFKRLLPPFIHLILPTIWWGDEVGRARRWENDSPKRLRRSTKVTWVDMGTITLWFLLLTRHSKEDVNGEKHWMEKYCMCLREPENLTGIITQLTAQEKDLWTVLKKHKWAGINTLQSLWINTCGWKLLESQLLA